MSEKGSLVNKLEKGRAECAYNFVKAIKQLDKEKQKDYKSYTRKIPQMILSNGLGQTLAFLKAKSEKGNAYELIYKQLTEYMKSNNTTIIVMPKNKTDLVEWMISCSSTEYRYITQELLSFLNWLKRFAEGLIEEEK